jgi:hypothetical protein
MLQANIHKVHICFINPSATVSSLRLDNVMYLRASVFLGSRRCSLLALANSQIMWREAKRGSESHIRPACCRILVQVRHFKNVHRFCNTESLPNGIRTSRNNSSVFCNRQFPVTERRSRTVIAPALYWGGPGFKSRPGNWLSLQAFSSFPQPL